MILLRALVPWGWLRVGWWYRRWLLSAREFLTTWKYNSTRNCRWKGLRSQQPSCLWQTSSKSFRWDSCQRIRFSLSRASSPFWYECSSMSNRERTRWILIWFLGSPYMRGKLQWRTRDTWDPGILLLTASPRVQSHKKGPKPKSLLPLRRWELRRHLGFLSQSWYMRSSL